MPAITSVNSRSGTVARLVAAVLIGCAAAVAVPGLAAAADLVRTGQWQLESLDADRVWAISTGSRVTVAVIDSGVDANHPDLMGQVLPGVDFVDPSSDGRVDPVGHGTAIAAFIAGRSDDSDGVVGFAPDAKILPVRVLDAKNRYYDSLTVARGVQWAVDHGARVINLSLGGPYSSALADALDYAFSRDVVVVACAGNTTPGGSLDVWYPAQEPGVVAVAGVDRNNPANDPLWSGSLTGPATVLLAPATDLVAAHPGRQYQQVEGTSFAASMVSAAAALIRARYPRLSAANVIERLTSSAVDLGEPGRDDRFGFGVLNPLGALENEVRQVSSNPLDNADRQPGIARFGPAAPATESATTLQDAPSHPTDRPRLIPAEDLAPPIVDSAQPRTAAASRGSRRTVDIAIAQLHPGA